MICIICRAEMPCGHAFCQGSVARVAGRCRKPPNDLPEARADAWLMGWDDADRDVGKVEAIMAGMRREPTSE